MPSEADAIAASNGPASAASLAEQLRSLGLERGAIVLVHSSLSALGWVAGGAQAVVEALFDVVDAPGSGTIVMPTQSGQLTDPQDWSQPPVPPEWVDTVRATLPAYDPDLTPTREMGQVVECFRQHRATIRSTHPTVSFAANGPHAAEIVGEHPLTPALGDRSPLGRLYDLDASILLLGVGHANNTSLHLAEHRADWPGRALRVDAAPLRVDGQRRWVGRLRADRRGVRGHGAGTHRNGRRRDRTRAARPARRRLRGRLDGRPSANVAGHRSRLTTAPRARTTRTARRTGVSSSPRFSPPSDPFRSKQR